eukprot:TRINITY_DN30631_c0_g1_i1.p1 TRINITY_DN30631_c0_g1~~TRINITY_DN30631_c0_g1_i1.p1  ORF type:complete len:165 (-),score=31.58 TRINITY_DN30631_c0_g1_i1:29-523(-)
MGANHCSACQDYSPRGRQLDGLATEEYTSPFRNGDQAASNDKACGAKSIVLNTKLEVTGSAAEKGVSANTSEGDYTITVNKKDNPKLGVDVESVAENKSLPILAITGGLVGLWNKEHPQTAVRVNGVNAVTGSVADMMERCKKDQELKVALRRFEYVLSDGRPK